MKEIKVRPRTAFDDEDLYRYHLNDAINRLEQEKRGWPVNAKRITIEAEEKVARLLAERPPSVPSPVSIVETSRPWWRFWK